MSTTLLKKILSILVIWIIAISCKKREDEPKVNLREIQIIQKIIRDKSLTSKIEVSPVHINCKECANIPYTKTHDEAGSFKYSYGEVSLTVSSETQDVNDDTFISFDIWRNALMQNILSTHELSSMNSRKITEYGKRMGVKYGLMYGNKESLIVEGGVNTVICMVDEDGKLRGRIWSGDHKITKVFHGKIPSNTDNTQRDCLIAVLSRAEIFDKQ